MILQGAFLSAGSMPLLSSHEIYDFDYGASPSASVSLVFKLNGELDKIEGGTTTTISPMQWWSAGTTGGIGTSYDVRCASIGSGPGFTTEAAAVGTYIQMSADRTWELTSTSIKSIYASFEIAETGTGIAIAQAFFTFIAETESFS